MQKGLVKDLTTTIVMNAAKISLQHNLPMADSLILATANVYECTLWTQDSDFENLPMVNFIPKKSVGQPGH
jgi:predicted nucleic acid-binding protein